METIKNTNGMDNASCPNCKHYNSMIYDNYDKMPEDNCFVATCRDCKYKCKVDLTIQNELDKTSKN